MNYLFSTTSNNVDFTTYVDANNWRVRNYGAWKEYEFTRSATPGVSVAANFTSSYIVPAIPLPVGITDWSKIKNITSSFMANDRIFTMNFRQSTLNADTSIAPNISNGYNTATTLSFYRIDIRITA